MPTDIDVKNWFLAPSDDLRSSNMLEIVASEFKVQGLEIDWAIVCWDADLRRDADKTGWDYYRFRGSKWTKRRQEEQKRYLDRVMTNDRENKMILCIMKDITKERKHKDQIQHAQLEAARMADKLVEEQLKIVQQIAGLLGETAADTKVAVEKLKNTILLESEKPNEKK